MHSKGLPMWVLQVNTLQYDTKISYGFLKKNTNIWYVFKFITCL